MSAELLVPLCAGIFVIALLYSAIGHAGASGYIAVMSLLSLAPTVIKPTALALNILVAAIASVQFLRAGHFSWRLFWPFAITAVPLAYVGGYLNLPPPAFKLIIGLILLYSAARFLVAARAEQPVRPVPLGVALACGGLLGLLSGLTGTGGGIFLTPLLLLMGWAHARQAAAVSAVFILLNSISGLLGNLASTQALPDELWLMLMCAAGGGLIGSHLGSRKLDQVTIKRCLASALLLAGVKMVFV